MGISGPTETVGGRTRAAAGIALGAAVVLAIATCAGQVVNRRLDLAGAWPELTDSFWLVNATSALIWAVPGWYLATRRPQVVYGWLALAAGVAHGLGGIGMEWAVAAQLGGHRLPVPTFALWLAVWMPLVEQPVLMVAYGRYPEGRPPRGWLRWPVVAAIALAIAGTIAAALDRFPARSAHDADLAGLANPFSLSVARSTPDSIAAFFGPAAVIIVIVLVIRWRQAEGESRRVLAWIVAVAVPITMIVPISVVALPGATGTAVAQLTTLLEVTVIVAATLRHRVYGIEIILDRALVLAAMTAVVAVVYGAAVGIAAAVGAGSSGTTSFVAALLAALALIPARNRIVHGVNRLVYGDRDDPYAVLRRISAQLASSGTVTELLPTLASATAAALRLPYVAIHLDGRPDATTIEHGTLTTATHPVPLVHQGRTLGRLVVGRRTGEGDLPARERQLLDDLATQVAVAASSVLLDADLRRSRERTITAREEERRRLRMDLHDGLGPQLTGIALGLDVVAEQLEATDPATATETDRLRTELHEAIHDVRRLVQGLRPPRLDEAGLDGALREMAERIRRSGLIVTTDIPEETSALPAAVEVAAYRIASEALTNVVRHAHATHCWLHLQIDDTLTLTVADDGRGLEDPGDGDGIANMRRRAEEIGGTCTISAHTPHGVLVTAELPIDQTDEVCGMVAP